MFHRLGTALAVMLVTLVGMATLAAAPAYAADFDYQVQSTVHVAADGTTNVSHNINVINNVATASPATLVLPVMGTEGTDFVAQYQDGEELVTTLAADGKTVTVNLPTSTGAGKQWSFSLEYKSIGLVQLGGASAVQIPPLTDAGLNIVKENLTVTADLDLGFATVIGPEPTTTKIGLGDQVLTFVNDAGSLGGSVALVFGDQAIIETTIETKLNNDSWWFQTKTLTLPPDTNQQQVFVQSISPTPDSVRLDADGNILVEYNLWPKSSVDVSARATVRTNAVTYDDSAIEGKDKIDSVLVERYTKLTDTWKASGLTIDVPQDASVLDTVKTVNQAVANEVTGELEAFSADNRVGALKYVDMEVGELRSRGIPARVVIGKSISTGSQLTDTPIDHAWLEAFVPGIGWMTVDPVFTHRSGAFGSTDIFHLGMALWGVEDDFPPVALQAVHYNYVTTDFPEPTEPASVSGTKYMILPGLSVFSVAGSVPSGQIIDDMGVRAEGSNKTFVLGSLAPLQVAKGRSFVFGANAFNQEHIVFGVTDDSGQIIADFADADTRTNYIPMMVLAGLIVLTILIVFIKRHRRKHPSRKATEANQVLSHEETGGDIESEDLLPAEERNRPRPIRLTDSPSTPKSATMNGDASNDVPQPPKRPKPPRLVQ